MSSRLLKWGVGAHTTHTLAWCDGGHSGHVSLSVHTGPSGSSCWEESAPGPGGSGRGVLQTVLGGPSAGLAGRTCSQASVPPGAGALPGAPCPEHSAHSSVHRPASQQRPVAAARAHVESGAQGGRGWQRRGGPRPRNNVGAHAGDCSATPHTAGISSPPHARDRQLQTPALDLRTGSGGEAPAGLPVAASQRRVRRPPLGPREPPPGLASHCEARLPGPAQSLARRGDFC